MIISDFLLDQLAEEAKRSPRLRQNYDLRNSPADTSQRMLNALEPGTIIPVHRHRTTSETTTVVRGAVRQNFYDDQGLLTESFEVRAGSSVPLYVVPQGVWHNTEALESGTIIFEAKDGAYLTPSPEDFMDGTLLLKARIQTFIEEEARSMSMETITPEYIYRMWGGRVPLEDIIKAMDVE